MTALQNISQQDTIDAHFVQMAQAIARSHDCEVEINFEERWIDFKAGNVTQQLQDDLMVLFEKYAV